jgi:hypothetical protein
MELIGKTISRVIAVPGNNAREPNRIWLLQFTDGTHVEFVSPAARRRLARLAGVPARARRGHHDDVQLTLEVA